MGYTSRANKLTRCLLVSVSLLAVCAVLFSSEEATAQTGDFGNLADGPYDRLVILNAMVLPGHGGPPVGPYDIVIEGNRITDMTIFDPVTVGRRGDATRATGDRVHRCRRHVT